MCTGEGVPMFGAWRAERMNALKAEAVQEMQLPSKSPARRASLNRDRRRRDMMCVVERACVHEERHTV